MVVATVKLQTVMGPDGDGFIGVLLHNMGHTVDVLPDSLVLTAVHFYIRRGMSIQGSVKGLPVNVVRNGENQHSEHQTYR